MRVIEAKACGGFRSKIVGHRLDGRDPRLLLGDDRQINTVDALLKIVEQFRLEHLPVQIVDDAVDFPGLERHAAKILHGLPCRLRSEIAHFAPSHEGVVALAAGTIAYMPAIYDGPHHKAGILVLDSIEGTQRDTRHALIGGGAHTCANPRAVRATRNSRKRPVPLILMRYRSDS